MAHSKHNRRVETLGVLLLALLVWVLSMMMGNRTPETLTSSGLVLVVGALLLTGGLYLAPGGRALPGPSTGWWVFAAALTGWVVLQVLPLPWLAAGFGPYPEAMWQGDSARPQTWSPNPNGTLRAWATFMALFLVAWTAGTLSTAARNLLWLAIAASALFQALYGLVSHAGGSETILGIWPRNNPDFVHGTFSNRNLFAGYLALTWPLVISVWWRKTMPGMKRLPFELRVAGSVICGAIVGAALLGSASRLGSAAGIAGLLIGLVLWTRYRARLRPVAVWPMYLTAFAALIAATWYGLTPLAERLAVTSIEEGRFEVYTLMITELPLPWWLAGVGLGGFEAVFKQVQPGDMTGWYDYAHNDLLQWLLEMGLVGLALLITVLVTLLANGRLNRERIPLYAGLGAQALVAIGDFSWHIPATQVVLAVYLGALLRPAESRRDAHPGKAPGGAQVKLRSI